MFRLSMVVLITALSCEMGLAEENVNSANYVMEGCRRCGPEVGRTYLLQLALALCRARMRIEWFAYLKAFNERTSGSRCRSAHRPATR